MKTLTPVGQIPMRETRPAWTGCAGCLSQGRCGSAQAFSPPEEAGPAVTPPPRLIRGAALAYLVPATAMLIGAVLGAGAGDAAAATGAVCGLMSGLLLLRRLATTLSIQARREDR
ncbi:SoxR reducing system RseC family protein [Thermochromatium tepidum]|uniref:Uncharacterized protein n=1 Tax=Thermochromatium tepidum ATCC 43061 TaxID=316276 RepID=A0A6I6DZR1_THETI|nr:SoxR reducing system RseC family protein [Thermochromatium tepidum]QGU33191.1 hypothetical protein E6P07_09520 [Thermochromatium tepidum ATCC 43061]